MEFSARNMADRVLHWANINSGSSNVAGLERMATVLMQAFSELSCETEHRRLPPIEQVNLQGETRKVEVGPLLRFWKRPTAPLQILLVGHMDTVFSMDHPFQTAEYQNENVLVGPGVSDMKGGICILLETLKAFEQDKLSDKLGWEVILNPDEEIGSIASATVLAERAKQHHLGLVFEPAMDEAGTLAGDRKGSGKFTIVVRGLAAHAGRDFHLGKNAINALAEILMAIEQLNGQREGLTLNIGQMEGGRAMNIVPDLAVAKLDIRFLRSEDEVWIRTALMNCLEKIKNKRGIQVDLFGQFGRKPKKLDKKTEKLYRMLVETAAEMGHTLSWKPSGGCSDGNNLSAVGLANVDTLGVRGGKIHSEEEYLIIQSLAERAELSYRFLQRLAKEGF